MIVIRSTSLCDLISIVRACNGINDCAIDLVRGFSSWNFQECLLLKWIVHNGINVIIYIFRSKGRLEIFRHPESVSTSAEIQRANGGGVSAIAGRTVATRPDRIRSVGTQIVFATWSTARGSTDTVQNVRSTDRRSIAWSKSDSVRQILGSSREASDSGRLQTSWPIILRLRLFSAIGPARSAIGPVRDVWELRRGTTENQARVCEQG